MQKSITRKVGWLALGASLFGTHLAEASEVPPGELPASEPARATPKDAAAGAEPTQASAFLRPGFGARVGGYGFRRADGEGAWDDCQMNGFGLFGTLDYNRHVYAELGADFYHATPDVVSHGMDRISTHTQLGLGLRMLPDFIISPVAQLGGGLEWTRIKVDGHETRGVFPVGYIGLGAEVNATEQFKLGASFRMLLTAHPVHEHAGDHGGAGDAHAADAGVQTEAELAAQAQFFLRYAL